MWSTDVVCRVLSAEIGGGASGLALLVESDRVTSRTRARIEPSLAEHYEGLLLGNLPAPDADAAVSIGQLRALPGLTARAGAGLADGIYVFARRAERVACAIVGSASGALPRHRRIRLEHAAARLAREHVVGGLRAHAERALVEAEGLGADEALRALIEGRLLPLERFDAGGRRVLVARVRTHGETTRGELTARERDVCERIASGQSNKRVALDLGITEPTVTTHLARALAKAGLGSRLDLIHLLRGVLTARCGAASAAAAAAVEPALVAARFVAGGEEFLAMSSPMVVPGGAEELARLSAAERAVAAAVLEGKSTAEIAADRRRSERTISNQIASVFGKVGVNSRAELAARMASRPLSSASASIQR